MGLNLGASYSCRSFHQGKEGKGECHTSPFNAISSSPPPLITYLLITNFTGEIEKDGWRGRLYLVGQMLCLT